MKEPPVGARQKKGHEMLWVWQPMERVMVVETTSSGWRPDALAVVLHPHIKGEVGRPWNGGVTTYPPMGDVSLRGR